MNATAPVVQRMRRRLSTGAVVLAALLLAGCSEPTYPPYALDPHPKDAVEILIKVENGPNGLEAHQARASYHVANQNCLPEVTNLQGVQQGPATYAVTLPVRDLGDGKYSFVLFLDQMSEKDYYGRGPCRWELALAWADFELPDVNERVYFRASSTSEALEQGVVTRYLPRHVHAQDNGRPYLANSISEDELDSLAQALKQEAFSIHMAAASKARLK